MVMWFKYQNIFKKFFGENINPFCGATDTPVLVTSILGDQSIPKIPQYQNIQISYEGTDCNIAACNALLSFTRH